MSRAIYILRVSRAIRTSYTVYTSTGVQFGASSAYDVVCHRVYPCNVPLKFDPSNLTVQYITVQASFTY
jgi:hypothetical protein